MGILCMSFSMAHAENKTQLTLKSTYAAAKSSICLSDIIEAHNLAQREAEKLSRYCRIEFKGARMTLNAKEIELHAWAAGVTPDKISGGPVTISMATTLQLPANKTAAPVKLRRGSAVQLVLKSEHMQIAREAALLQDAFAGETVDVRPAGTRKTLRAKLVSNTVAELVQ
ncbi:MAG TPA: flagella basal body P-ring formation protein FlgA [Turneriella sp.]|nr:flagella basal body P-ring formation protein FlgA [Turneriella sp.]